jgi:hypothetical protein
MSTGGASTTGSPAPSTGPDHYHVARRIWEVSGADRARFDELKRLALSDPLACARRLRRSPRLHRERAAEAAGYLEGVAPDLHGVDRLPRRLRRGRMRVVGSGVVEKHQDLLVARRMKGRGMRWTRRGADHLLALQARRISRPLARAVGGGRQVGSRRRCAAGPSRAPAPIPSGTRGTGGQGGSRLGSLGSAAEIGTL